MTCSSRAHLTGGFPDNRDPHRDWEPSGFFFVLLVLIVLLDLLIAGAPAQGPRRMPATRPATRPAPKKPESKPVPEVVPGEWLGPRTHREVMADPCNVGGFWIHQSDMARGTVLAFWPGSHYYSGENFYPTPQQGYVDPTLVLWGPMFLPEGLLLSAGLALCPNGNFTRLHVGAPWEWQVVDKFRWLRMCELVPPDYRGFPLYAQVFAPLSGKPWSWPMVAGPVLKFSISCPDPRRIASRPVIEAAAFPAGDGRPASRPAPSRWPPREELFPKEKAPGK